MKKTGIALKYGYKAPLQDYHKFNCSRQDNVRIASQIFSYFVQFQYRQEWKYDRSQLIYMREIGEGNFGKVLLMKAKVI